MSFNPTIENEKSGLKRWKLSFDFEVVASARLVQSTKMCPQFNPDGSVNGNEPSGLN